MIGFLTAGIALAVLAYAYPLRLAQRAPALATAGYLGAAILGWTALWVRHRNPIYHTVPVLSRLVVDASAVALVRGQTVPLWKSPYTKPALLGAKSRAKATKKREGCPTFYW